MNNLARFQTGLLKEWHFSTLFIPVIGSVFLCKFRRRLALFLALYFLTLLFFVINYRIVDIEAYYIQGIIPICMCFGAGLYFLIFEIFKARNNQTVKKGVTIAAFFLLIVQISNNFIRNWRSESYVAYDYGINIFNTVPPNTFLITQGWSSPFVFSYLEHVMFYRPDVRVMVDYKGSNFKLAYKEKWEIPVCTTVPVEVIGLEDVRFWPKGLVYWLNLGFSYGDSLNDNFSVMRYRSLDEIYLPSDFHSIALIAGYYAFRGEYLISVGETLKGLALLRYAEEIGKWNNLILCNLSSIYFKWGCYSESERLARKSLALDDRFYQAHHNLGNSLMKQERYNEAVREYEFSEDQRISLGRTYQALGYGLLKCGDNEKAIEPLVNALKFDPGSLDLKLNLAVAELRTCRWEEAEKLIKEILQIKPDCSDAWNDQGILFLNQGKVDEARESLNKAIQYDPNSIDAKINLGILLGQTSQTEDSERMFLEILNHNSENVAAMNNLALLYYNSGKKDAAVILWKRSIQNNQWQPHVIENLKLAGISEKELNEEMGR
jgi:tetratricopeptide (TPR) repeat protein